jgi:hypothetical protein
MRVFGVKGSVTYGYLCRKRDLTSATYLEQRIDLSQDLCLQKENIGKTLVGFDHTIRIF